MGLYGIGQAVLREEDPRLLKGKGRYADDFAPAGLARGVVLRSPYAHAVIKSINAAAARAAPGVLAVLTGEDLKQRGLGAQRPLQPRKRSDGSPAHVTPQPLLADDRVRFVGQPVAFVVAENLAQARDAAELIETLSAPERRILRTSSTVRIPPPTVKGIKIFSSCVETQPNTPMRSALSRRV